MNRRQKKKKAKSDAIKQAIDQVISERANGGEPKTAAKKAEKTAAKEKGAAKVIIDCAGFETKAKIHEAFHKEPAFPDYEGNNLDAMFDMLTEIAAPTEIVVKHLAEWEAAPDSYKGNIKKLLERADRENPNVKVLFD